MSTILFAARTIMPKCSNERAEIRARKDVRRSAAPPHHVVPHINIGCERLSRGEGVDVAAAR